MPMPTCKVCGGRFGLIELRDGMCRSCRDAAKERTRFEEDERERRLVDAGLVADVSPRILDEKSAHVILTTGLSVPGREIASILSIVGAEAAVGMNIFRDIANNWVDTLGGRSGSVQKTLKEARETAMRELKREAFLVGADAVISVDIDYNQVSTSGGSGGSILFVAATGTAVKLDS
ncbi:YbjQ family protein [Rhizobium leguminosarum]